jgi:hypothetical protein
MTHYLVSDENPNGLKLELLLMALRREVLTRCNKIADDTRPEAQHVLKNNIKVLEHLTAAIELADDSTHVLDKAFGPSQSAKGGPPRIGVE